jgi:hypothetical protein
LAPIKDLVVELSPGCATVVAAYGSALEALGAVLPKLSIGPTGLFRIGSTRLSRKGKVVLAASVNIGMPKL